MRPGARTQDTRPMNEPRSPPLFDSARPAQLRDRERVVRIALELDEQHGASDALNHAPCDSPAKRAPRPVIPSPTTSNARR